MMIFFFVLFCFWCCLKSNFFVELIPKIRAHPFPALPTCWWPGEIIGWEDKTGAAWWFSLMNHHLIQKKHSSTCMYDRILVSVLSSDHNMKKNWFNSWYQYVVCMLPCESNIMSYISMCVIANCPTVFIQGFIYSGVAYSATRDQMICLLVLSFPLYPSLSSFALSYYFCVPSCSQFLCRQSLRG